MTIGIPKPTPTPKKMRTPLPRSSVKRSTTPIKKKNVKRARANHARAYGEKAEWIRQQPCCVCGYAPSEAAHVGTGGTGRKASSGWLIPLCGPHAENTNDLRFTIVSCHRESHRGIKTFQKKYALDLLNEATKYEDLYLAYLNGTE